MIVVENEGISYPALSYRLRQEANDLTHRVEVSENLQTWQSGDALTVIVAPPLTMATEQILISFVQFTRSI